jgi:hypothetical protein
VDKLFLGFAYLWINDSLEGSNKSVDSVTGMILLQADSEGTPAAEYAGFLGVGKTKQERALTGRKARRGPQMFFAHHPGETTARALVPGQLSELLTDNLPVHDVANEHECAFVLDRAEKPEH